MTNGHLNPPRAAVLASAALLLIALAGCAPQATEAVAEAPASAEPETAATCSPQEASDASSFAVINTTDDAVDVLWYSYDCVTEPYATLAPGETVTLESYVGHRWVATASGSDAAVSEFEVPAASGTWTID